MCVGVWGCVGVPRCCLAFLTGCFFCCFFSSFCLFFSLSAPLSGEKGGLVSVGYGEDDFTRLDGDEEGYEEEDEEASRQSVSTPRPLSAPPATRRPQASPAASSTFPAFPSTLPPRQCPLLSTQHLWVQVLCSLLTRRCSLTLPWKAGRGHAALPSE